MGTANERCNVKAIGRYLIIDNQKYDYNTIPDDLKYFFPFSRHCKMEISIHFLKPNVHIIKNFFPKGSGSELNHLFELI